MNQLHEIRLVVFDEECMFVSVHMVCYFVKMHTMTQRLPMSMFILIFMDSSLSDLAKVRVRKLVGSVFRLGLLNVFNYESTVKVVQLSLSLEYSDFCVWLSV